MRTQEIWGNFPLGYWKYGLCAWSVFFPQEARVAFVEPLLGALSSHCIVFFAVGRFFPPPTLGERNLWSILGGLMPCWKVDCKWRSNWYVFDSHLRTWMFWELGHFCIKLLKWWQFLWLLCSVSHSTTWVLYIHAKHLYLLLCVVLKISQFLTLVWQQGVWWDQFVFQLLAPATASSGS